MNHEFGSDVLKITPGHDTNHYAIGEFHRLYVINNIGRDAAFSENAFDFSGLDCFNASKKVWYTLVHQNLVIEVKDHSSHVLRIQRGGEVIEPPATTKWATYTKHQK